MVLLNLSFTEVIQTPGAAIKYTVHSQGTDGLPDIEMSVSKDNEQAQKAALERTVKPSEMAEVAKMIEQHNREAAERKKAKAASEQGRSSSSESNVETIQTQLKEAKQCWKQMKSQQPQECAKAAGGPCTGCPKTAGSGPCAGCTCGKSK